MSNRHCINCFRRKCTLYWRRAIAILLASTCKNVTANVKLLELQSLYIQSLSYYGMARESVLLWICPQSVLTWYRLKRFGWNYQTWYIYFWWQEDNTYCFWRSGVKGQGHTLKTVLLKLVNRIKTELFQLGMSNLVYILLMTRGWHLLLFNVMGQRSM